MNKFKFFKQLEARDCGATCLKMISNYYNKKIDIRYLRDITYTSKNGVSLSSLIEAAENIGFDTLPTKITYKQLIEEVPLPAILHWQNTHYVVAYNTSITKKGERVLHIADPAYGILKLKQSEVSKLWNIDGESNGVALLLEPKSNFDLEKVPTPKKNNFNFFSKYSLPIRKKLILILILAIIISSFNFLYPYLNQHIIDDGIKDKNIKIIYFLILAQFAAYTSSFIFETVQAWLFLKIRIKFSIDIVNDFLIKLLKMPISFFENRLLADILLRIDDHDKIENFFSQTTINFLITTLTFVVFSIMLWNYSILIFFTFLVGTLISILWVLWFHNIRKFLNYKKFELNTLNKNILYEIINGVEDIKINNFENAIVSKWKSIQNELNDINKKNLRLANIQEFGVNYISQIKNLIILSTAAFMAVDNNLTLGALLAISFIIGQLNAPLESFVFFIYSLQDAKIGAERLVDVYEKDDEISLTQTNENPDSINTISFEKIKFGYSNPNDSNIFENLNFTIKGKCTTAIVGTSGSGKTTLTKLLMKFYTPFKGNIIINDNIPLSNVPYEIWRQKISVVFQDGYIFSDSIKGNIIMGQTFHKEKFFDILFQTNLIDFINILPQQEETKVGENGVGLSQGQKQRILIARAMYKNPEILILDEATSSLDSENEKIIHDNLQSFFKNKTVIIIAHRLSTVKNADQIIVLKNGSIQEQGSHKDLINNKKDYYNLVKNQLELAQ